MSKQEMAAGYAWKQTLSGSGQWDVKVSFWGGGRENSDPNMFTPTHLSLYKPTTEPHKHTQKHITMYWV